VQYFRNREQVRREELHSHFVVAPDVRAHAPICFIGRRVADPKDTGAGKISVNTVRSANVEPITKQVERDWKRAEANGRVTRGGDVRVSVTRERDDARHLENDLVARQCWDARMQRLRGILECLGARRVVEVPVPS
jgi:hypothetical protein